MKKENTKFELAEKDFKNCRLIGSQPRPENE